MEKKDKIKPGEKFVKTWRIQRCCFTMCEECKRVYALFHPRETDSLATGSEARGPLMSWERVQEDFLDSIREPREYSFAWSEEEAGVLKIRGPAVL